MGNSKIRTREEHISRTLYMLNNNLLRASVGLFKMTILCDKGVEVITFKKYGKLWELI